MCTFDVEFVGTGSGCVVGWRIWSRCMLSAGDLKWVGDTERHYVNDERWNLFIEWRLARLASTYRQPEVEVEIWRRIYGQAIAACGPKICSAVSNFVILCSPSIRMDFFNVKCQISVACWLLDQVADVLITGSGAKTYWVSRCVWMDTAFFICIR